MQKNKTSTEAVVDGIGDALKARMPSIEKWYSDFPAPNQKLKFPCFSIFTQAPSHTPHIPRIFHQEKIGEGPESKVFYSVGRLEFNLQIDFWCENKVQRGKLIDEFIEAMTLMNPTAGLTLKLTDYYDQLIHADFSDVNFQRDSEESSQRGEFRFLVSVVVDLEAIIEKTENLIQTIETDLEVGP